MKGVLCDEALRDRFAQLTELLKTGEQFWRHHAFQYLRLPWEKDFPELSRQLRALPLLTSELFARDNNALIDFLSPHLPLSVSILSVCAIGRFDEELLPDIEPRDIPGRKWQQIRHFAACVPVNDFSILEWCAGKSHLGRALSHQRDCAVSALECDSRLIESGKILAARERVAVEFHCVDVMSQIGEALLHPTQNVLALHACGDLHLRLLQSCADNGIATITLAPCCYHLMQNESQYFLSQAARVSGLQLHRGDLRTAVQGTVTAPARQHRQRQQLQAWRLGFDVLQREVRGRDEYLPTPSLSTRVLANGFAAFCHRVATLKDVNLPRSIDYARYETAGHVRLREVTALDLPRIAFRRVLELWLALDRALFLRERGYRVEVGEFCAAALTPRNILIRSQL